MGFPSSLAPRFATLTLVVLAQSACDDEPADSDPDASDTSDSGGDASSDPPPGDSSVDLADGGDTADPSDGGPVGPPGEVLWTALFDARFTNITFPSFGLAGEMLVLAVGFGSEIDEPTVVYRLDPATGDSLWDDDTLLSIGGGPCVMSPSGTCWVTDIATGAQRLVELSVEGEILEDFPLPNGENPHVEGLHGEDLVLTQTWFVGIEAFDPDGAGTAAWLDADDQSANKRVLAISADGTSWIGQSDLGIYQRDAAGQAGWTAEFENAPCRWLWEASALTADGGIAAGCNDPEAAGGGWLWLVDDQGEEVGSVELAAGIAALAVAEDGDLLIGTGAGLTRRDPTGEEERWSALEDAEVYGLSVGDSGHVYGLAIVDGTEYRVFSVAADGELAWDYVPEGVQFTGWPTLGPDGRLYVSIYLSDGGRQLVALGTDSTGLADSAWPTFNHDNGRTRQGE